MKKIILLFCLLLTACQMETTTPVQVVRKYFTAYQELSESALNGINTQVNEMSYYTEKQKKKYKEALIKQYQNLSYKIQKEEIIKNSAIVEVEIEVLDYHQTMNNTKEYFYQHQEEFTNKIIDKENIKYQKEYIDYELEELLRTENKTKYQLTFYLTKDNNNWELDYVEESIIKKIQGLY